MRPVRHRLWPGLLVVGVVALLLRLIHIYQVSSNPFFAHPIVDAWDYHLDALGIVQTGDWIGDRVFFQAPLFTYFLALIYKIFGAGFLWPRLLQAVLGTLSAMGVFVLGQRLFGTRAAWVSGLATACYSVLIFYDGELLAPTLTIALDVTLFLVLFASIRQRSAWLLAVPGLLLGVRALATTNILAAVPVFWIWLAFQGRRLDWPRRHAAVAGVAFTVGIAAAVVPVTVRNHAITDQFVLVSSNAGINFYLGNSGDYETKVAIRPGADWDEFVNRHVHAGLKVGPEMSGYFLGEAWKYIRSHRVDYLRLLLYKTYLFMRGDEILRNQEIYAFRSYSRVLKMLLWKLHIPRGPGLAFPFGVLLPLAWPGCLLVLRKRHAHGALLWGFAIVYGLSVAAFFVTARYRVPVVIPLVLLTAYGWTEVRQWWQLRRLRNLALTGMVALGLVSNWDVGPMAEEMNPDAYYSLATTMAEQGNLNEAERYYRKVLELNPDDASAWVNLGLYVYEARGLPDQAEACYRRSLAARPDYALAVYNLARMAELGGKQAEAEWFYREAIRLDPLMTGPYNNLAVMALGRGDFAGAQKLYKQVIGIDPENVAALIGLGITTFKTGGLKPALEFFDRARSREPENPDIYYNLSLVYAESAEPGKAADAARRVIELVPHDDMAYMIFAGQMQAAGRSDEARAYLEGLIRRHPGLAGPRSALHILR